MRGTRCRCAGPWLFCSAEARKRAILLPDTHVHARWTASRLPRTEHSRPRSISCVGHVYTGPRYRFGQRSAIPGEPASKHSRLCRFFVTSYVEEKIKNVWRSSNGFVEENSLCRLQIV